MKFSGALDSFVSKLYAALRKSPRRYMIVGLHVVDIFSTVSEEEMHVGCHRPDTT